MLASGIAQVRRDNGTATPSHPGYRPHLMQGWSPDFIPRLVDEVTSDARIDGFILVDGQDALRCSRELARQEGLFVGISAGATFSGALRVAEVAPQGANILCMLPDTGERYLSTPLFEDVATEMTKEEIEISRSTPGFRFDIETPATTSIETPIELEDAAVSEVDAVLHDPDQPVVMFANEWCEFCDSVRKVFAEYNIPYTAIDLDSSVYRENDRGRKLYDVVKKRTGSYTLPQIFIGGDYIGGCTEVFDSLKSGQLQHRLQEYAIQVDPSIRINPYDLLPKWLHPR